MPQLPIVIPVIVLGIAVGSLLRRKSAKISKKTFAYAPIGAGLLNAAYAYVFLLLFPAPTFSRGNFAVGSVSEPVFIAASFMVAVVLVAAVLGIAQGYSRARGGDQSEETPEPLTEEPKAASG